MATLQETEGFQFAHHAVQLVSEKQASDILLLDIREHSSFADFFILLTADNRRQIATLVQELDHGLTQHGAHLHHQEGTPESGWVLLDFGDVVVHIFTAEERQFYHLEQLWARAMPLVRIQ